MAARSSRLRLRPYQRDAVTAIDVDEERALLVAACGTGKTLMAAHAAAKLLPDGPAAVLVVFPTLGLLEQTYCTWRREAPFVFDALAVCSAHLRDTEDIRSGELSIASTTSPHKLIEWRHEVSGVGVVFCTYQSLPVIAAAHAEGMAAWEVTVFDFSSRANAVRHVRQHGEMRLCHTPRRYCSRHPMRVTESGRVKGGGCTRERWSTSSRPRTTRTIRRASRYSTPAPPRSIPAAIAG